MIRPYPGDKDAATARSVRGIYNFLCCNPRCGAVCPGTFVPVLTCEGKCSCWRAKPAHFVGHLPAVCKGQRSYFPVLGFHRPLEPLALQAKASLNENISYSLLKTACQAESTHQCNLAPEAFTHSL